MPGADVFDFPVRISRADDHGGELPSGSAVAEQPICVRHQVAQRQVLSGESAKCSVKIAHQHRSSHALTRHVAQQKQERAVGFDQVAVVAADQVGGLIVIASLPAVDGPVSPRQKRTLKARGKSEITFECSLLVLREMVKAEAQQRIAQQTIGLDAVMAGFANAEGAGVQTGKSVVDAGEKLMK